VLDKASPSFRKRAEAMAAAHRSKPKPHYTSHKIQRPATAASPYLPSSNANTALSVWQPNWR
jgi:hypothetical protein